jgi:hypothetical protein
MSKPVRIDDDLYVLVIQKSKQDDRTIERTVNRLLKGVLSKQDYDVVRKDGK